MPAEPLRLQVDGTSHVLTPDAQWLVGRDPAVCRVVVLHPLVSSRHLRLRHDGTYWRAADAGSTNGTWHNGTRISEIVVNGDIRLRLAADMLAAAEMWRRRCCREPGSRHLTSFGVTPMTFTPAPRTTSIASITV